MESWCFDSLDSGYASNEILTQSEPIIRNKDVLMEWDENSIFVENSVFPDVGLSEIVPKQCPNDSSKNVFSSVVVPNPIFWGEDESSSVVDSNSRELSQIDLKLGASRVAPCSSESSTRVKRSLGFGAQIVYCQVLGCSKDLSSAKDYHKRHKVCDAHSKTSRVIVTGIEQRFCQQCSRFHLLGEFDDGKRSCRKRLASHNQRRRKPQIGYNNGRAGRSFSYSGSVGSKFQGTTTLTSSSLTYQDILPLPRTASNADKYRITSWDNTHVKIEENKADYSHNSSNILINGHLHQNTGFINEDKWRENTTTFNAAAASTVPDKVESGCALSLLSSQSGIANRSQHYNVTEESEKLLGVRAWDLPSNGCIQGSGFVNANDGLSCENGATVNLFQLSSQLRRVENQRHTVTSKQDTESF